MQPSKKQKILMVDDTPSNIHVLGETLQGEQDIFVATSGEEALSKVRDIMPDLILLDIIMPGIDGYEVCRQLKADGETADIPVIFITTMDGEHNETKGLSLGAVDYITKPFVLPVVQARVRTHLDLKRKSDFLESLSVRDGLTGVYNRRRFDEVIANEWKRAQRYQKHLGIILLDIDHFKLYNDNYGHLAGDECLKAVANQISASVQRITDTVARYGGEEFAVIAPDTDREGVEQLGEGIRVAVTELKIEHAHSSVAPFMTVSVGGCSLIPSVDVDYKMALAAADDALYAAKGTGRNQVQIKTV